MDNPSELRDAEEAKRERNWSPSDRWQVIQQTLARAEAQATVRRNTREACLAKQRFLLASLAEWQRRQAEQQQN